MRVDLHIGRLLAFLRDSGQYDDTLIVVTADHGEMLGDQHLWGKLCPFDAALKIPLIIRDPETPESFGQVVENFTESVDIAPTLAHWTGADANPAHDGRSLLPVLQGKVPDDWRHHVFAEAELGDPEVATQYQRNQKLPFNRANFSVLRDEQYKYVHFNGDIAPLLYDLKSDPDEGYNVAGDDTLVAEKSRLLCRMIDHRMSYASAALSGMKVTEKGLFKG